MEIESITGSMQDVSGHRRVFNIDNVPIVPRIILQHISAVVHDLNNDTEIDVAVADTDSNNVGIFFGYGNGNFQPQVTYSSGIDSQPYSVAVGDFNNDQYLDIVTANWGTNSVGILTGHGNGTFDIVRLYSVGSSRPVSIAAADLNNDVCLDVVFVNYDTSTLVILFGDCHASFSSQYKYSTGYDSLPHSVIIADFNNDSILDIAVSNSGIDNVAVFFGYANETFSTPELFSTGMGSNPYTIAVGNLNGDDYLDIVVANYKSSTIGALLGLGNRTFTNMIFSSIGSNVNPYSMVVDDFNNDDIQDVAVVNPGNDSTIVLLGSGNGTFFYNEIHFTSLYSTPISIGAADFNKDGLLDLITVNNGTNSVEVFIRYIYKPFSDKVIYSTGVRSYPMWASIADFNNDGYSDIAALAAMLSLLEIFLGYGNGSFAPPISFSTGSNSAPFCSDVGDFNKDNALDIVVADSYFDAIAIFFGFGNGSFKPMIKISTGVGSAPNFVVVGDLNRDDILDIAVANRLGPNIGIFLGYENGTFTNQTTYSTGERSGPNSLALGDINKDTIVDIVVGNSKSNTVGILFGFGNGTFSAQTTMPTGNNSYPGAVALGDLNNDTMLDIAVANYFDDNVKVFLNTEKGSSWEVRVFDLPSGSNPAWIILDDFNNDRLLDIAVINSGSNTIAILFGYGYGHFGALTQYSTGDGSRPFALAAGNLNHDIWLDIVVVNLEGSSIGLFFGLAPIYLANRTTYSTGTGSKPYSVIVSNINNDTLADLLIINSAYDNINIRLGNGDGTFRNEITYGTVIGSVPHFATVADFNNDHIPDISIANPMANSITVAYGIGNGSFTGEELYATGPSTMPQLTVVGDFNGDNLLDMTVLNKNTSTIGVFLSFDYAKYTMISSISTGRFTRPVSVVVDDFNHDGFLDFATTNYGMDNVGVFFGYGNGSFQAPKFYITEINGYPYWIDSGDVNNDNIVDIVVADSTANNIAILLGYHNGTFARSTYVPTGNKSLPTSVELCDLNKDGLLDLVVANNDGNSVGIFLGYGNGTFTQYMIIPTGVNSIPFSAVPGDLNNDTIPDIVAANYGTATVLILKGLGNGNFTPLESYSMGKGSGTFAVTLADVNKDNLVDITVANRVSSTIVVLLGYGNGSFEMRATYFTGEGSTPVMIAIDDFNSDTKLDMAVVNYGSNNFGIFFGYGDGTFTQQLVTDIGEGTQPGAIAVKDFDGDNQLDILMVNFGISSQMTFIRAGAQPFLTMNSYSTGDDSQPEYMATADLNQDHHLDLIIANTLQDNVGIMIGYGNGSFMQLKPYDTGKGSAPCYVAVGYFNEDNVLDIVVANAGTNNLGILIGYGNGTFSIAMFYTTGVESSPHSVAISDFNKDNCSDLVVVNANSKNLLIFFGYCNGTFGESNSHSLGFESVPYSIAANDFNRDGWMDVTVADYGADYVYVLLQTCSNN